MKKLSDYLGQTYKVIKNYIPREEADRISNKFIADSIEHDYTTLTTDFIDNCIDELDYPEATAIATEKVAYLNELLGEKVVPSYTFTRIYRDGSELKRHEDKNSCEISLSVHLYGDKDWEFVIDDLDGNAVEIILEPGDAILYDAIHAAHWRKGKYTGENYVQTFHHYVFLNGDYQDHIYNNAHRELFTLEHYIRVYKNEVPADVCSDIIDMASSEQYDDRWRAASTIDQTDARVCSILPIEAGDTYIDSTLQQYVMGAIHKYANEFSWINLTEDCGYGILKYEPGGKYDYHTDQHNIYNREITLIINLNDGYEGGQLSFGESVTVHRENELSTGDLCIFPSNFMYPHAIKPITSGVRYSVITWAS